MLNKLTHSDHIVYLVGLHIYYKMIYGPYNVKFLVRLFKNPPASDFIKLFPVGVEFVRAFRNFANTPDKREVVKKEYLLVLRLFN